MNIYSNIKNNLKESSSNKIPRNWKKISGEMVGNSSGGKAGDKFDIVKDEYGRAIMKYNDGKEYLVNWSMVRSPEMVKITNVELNESGYGDIDPEKIQDDAYLKIDRNGDSTRVTTGIGDHTNLGSGNYTKIPKGEVSRLYDEVTSKAKAKKGSLKFKDKFGKEKAAELDKVIDDYNNDLDRDIKDLEPYANRPLKRKELDEIAEITGRRDASGRSERQMKYRGDGAYGKLTGAINRLKQTSRDIDDGYNKITLESDDRQGKIISFSKHIKDMANEMASIAEMYDESMLDDEDDVFGGTEDSYAMEMLDQHISDIFLNDPVFSKLDDGTLTDVISDIINTIVNGNTITFESLLMTLKKYDALKQWSISIGEGETFTFPKEVVDKVNAEYEANKPQIRKEIEQEYYYFRKQISKDDLQYPGIAAMDKAYKDAIKDPEDIWCECGAPMGEDYKENGDSYLGVEKEGYICNSCKKYVQIG